MFTLDLQNFWAGIIAVAVLAYVILDGFDLGVGILFPTAKSTSERDIMMNSVAPVWDGNETWLVLGGGGLLAAFPLAYAVVLPALYAPIIAMLIGLVLRGVAFEFRWRTERGKFVWDWSFFFGSLSAALAQGIALGALVQGIPVANRAYAGGWWNWLTPFSMLTGIAVVVGYVLLGSTWLNMKTENEIQLRCRQIAKVAAICLLILMASVSLWTPFLQPVYFIRWFAWPAALYSSFVPILVLLCAWALYSGLKKSKDTQPFVASLGLFVVSFMGLGISFYPYIVPPTLTIHDAAAPVASLMFMLPGIIILVPIILIYTAYSYWVFRGKVKSESGYH
jgi:cytochrome bd ubiquinol oxidase subunit II